MAALSFGHVDRATRLPATHVCFFRPETIAWIADWQGWTAEAVAPNVTLFRV